MDRQAEKRPGGSVEETKQAGETCDQWKWVEPSVWTERMLNALEEGVKGGKWFSLIDKVSSVKSLQSAVQRVRKNGGSAGVDHQRVEDFDRKEEENLAKLSKSLQEGTYEPQAIRRKWIPKEGSREMRPLGIPTVQDRIVQGSLRNVLEPIFEKDFANQSYGFRPNRGCKDALRKVEELLKKGYTWIVDADLKGYFDSIPTGRLMKKVEEKVSDGRVLELLRKYLKQGVMENMKEWTPERGTPQGAVISPLLSNIYLDDLDHLMEEQGHQMVRYADDFVILAQTREEAESALAKVKEWVQQAELMLHPEKTKVVDATQYGGFDFLGYHFERGYRWPRKKSLRKFRDRIRQKTRRANGGSLNQIIAEVNPIIRGWFEYFKHSIRNVLEAEDKWIRMRIRSILRKRHGGKGRGKGLDHIKWPNSFFQQLGLFSMTTARIAVVQSRRGGL